MRGPSDVAGCAPRHVRPEASESRLKDNASRSHHFRGDSAGGTLPWTASSTRDVVNRRGFLGASAVAAVGAPLGALWLTRREREAPAALPARPLRLPTDGTIRTAVAIGDGFNVIDVSGPWEALQDAVIGHGPAQFELYTAAESTASVSGTGGLRVTPAYSYDTAPQPHVVVIPAHGATPATTEWLQHVAGTADLLMSVCTGAFVLADTGLLDGKTATTHHGSWDDFEQMYPKVELLRGPRFVEHDHVASAGGLASGIDLALRVVERYLGSDIARQTAEYMEYKRVQV
jgi:putative intracellular protease/amidase